MALIGGDISRIKRIMVDGAYNMKEFENILQYPHQFHGCSNLPEDSK
jgi:hypothetical protein